MSLKGVRTEYNLKSRHQFTPKINTCIFECLYLFIPVQPRYGYLAGRVGSGCRAVGARLGPAAAAAVAAAPVPGRGDVGAADVVALVHGEGGDGVGAGQHGVWKGQEGRH